MPIDKRDIIRHRRELPARVEQAFLPAETAINEGAARIAICVSILIEGHGNAQLDPKKGSRATELLAEAAHRTAQARALVMEAHCELAELATEFGYVPYCPPNEGTSNVPAIRAVA